MPIKRRTFLVGGALAAGALGVLGRRGSAAAATAPLGAARVSVPPARIGEDVFSWLTRVHGGYDVVKFRQVLGAANPYKEGDDAQGLAAENEQSRVNSRRLLANTTLRAFLAHPIYEDEVVAFADAQVDATVRRTIE